MLAVVAVLQLASWWSSDFHMTSSTESAVKLSPSWLWHIIIAGPVTGVLEHEARSLRGTA